MNVCLCACVRVCALACAFVCVWFQVHPSLREPGRPEHGGGVHRCVLREVDGRGGPGRLTGQPGGVTPPDTHPPLHADLREPEP